MWMEKNKTYRVWYKLDNHRTPRAFVGMYLGVDVYGQEQFSLRPAAGTSSLPKDAIEAFRPTTAPASQPVKVQNIPSMGEDETTGYQYGPNIKKAN